MAPSTCRRLRRRTLHSDLLFLGLVSSGAVAATGAGAVAGARARTGGAVECASAGAAATGAFAPLEDDALDARAAVGLLQTAAAPGARRTAASTEQRPARSTELVATSAARALAGSASGAGSSTDAPDVSSILGGFADQLRCETHPTMCGPPFNCWSEPLTPEMTDRMRDVRVATDDGHPNLKAWCTDPSFEDSVVPFCIKHPDLVKNGHLVFEKMKARGVLDYEASYCFLEGHCANEEVTPATTMAEAEQMCDEKYGHERWTNVKYGDQPSPPSDNWHTKNQTDYFGMVACAMGNWHCDVVYCRETLCTMPEYVEKWGHLAEESGGGGP